jgi:hypothetical protein
MEDFTMPGDRSMDIMLFGKPKIFVFCAPMEGNDMMNKAFWSGLEMGMEARTPIARDFFCDLLKPLIVPGSNPVQYQCGIMNKVGKEDVLPILPQAWNPPPVFSPVETSIDAVMAIIEAFYASQFQGAFRLASPRVSEMKAIDSLFIISAVKIDDEEDNLSAMIRLSDLE